MPFRAAVFTGLGVFGFVPVIHQSFFTWDHMPTPVRIAMGHLLVMGACYLTVRAASSPLTLTRASVSVVCRQAARGRARPPCTHLNNQPCCCLGSAFEVAAFRPKPNSPKL